MSAKKKGESSNGMVISRETALAVVEAAIEIGLKMGQQKANNQPAQSSKSGPKAPVKNQSVNETTLKKKKGVAGLTPTQQQVAASKKKSPSPGTSTPKMKPVPTQSTPSGKKASAPPSKQKIPVANKENSGRVSPTPSLQSTSSVQSGKSKASTTTNSRSDISTVMTPAQKAVTSPSDAKIIVVIDGNQQYAGGFILLPLSNVMHFYCIDWSNIFSFSSGEKPDIANACLSLEIFGNYIRRERKLYNGQGRFNVLLKASTNLAESGDGMSSRSNKSLFQKFETKLGGIQGSWQQYKPTDNHGKIAWMLSNGKFENVNLSSLQIPNIPKNYKQTDISKSDYSALHSLAVVIPDQRRFK